MVELTKYLRNAGYDLIEGPVRNHKLLQLWLKEPFEKPELYYAHISQALISKIELVEIENAALSVNSSHIQGFGFNIGMTALEDILRSLGVGNVDLTTKLKSGKKVTISYDNSITKECAIGNIVEYLSPSSLDIPHTNPSLMKKLNLGRVLLITGTVLARNLVVDIETDMQVDAALVAVLNEIVSGKLKFSISSNKTLKIISSDNIQFPIAVKASRIDFDHGMFDKLILVTDGPGSNF